MHTHFTERSCVRVGHHLQMVSIGAKGARNVQIFDAELPKTANPFCGRFHVTEYGFMRESKLNISKLLKPQSDYYQRQLK